VAADMTQNTGFKNGWHCCSLSLWIRRLQHQYPAHFLRIPPSVCALNTELFVASILNMTTHHQLNESL